MPVYRCLVAEAPHIIADDDVDALRIFQAEYGGINFDVMEVRVNGMWERVQRPPVRMPPVRKAQPELPLTGGTVAVPEYRKLGFGAVCRS